MNLKKMYGTVICGMIVLLIIIVALLWNLNSLISQSRNLNQDGIKLITLSNDMLHNNDYLIKIMRVLIHEHNDTALLDEYYSLLTYENLEGKLNKMLEIGLTDAEKLLVDELLTMLDNLAEIESRALEANKNGDYLAAESIIYSGEYANIDFQLSQKTTDLIISITDRVNSGVLEIQIKLQAMKIFISIFFAFAIIALIILQIMQRNRVLKPIVEIEGIMNSVSEGKTGIRLVKKHDDEIGSLFDHVNTMADSIEAYMKEAQNSLNILKNILNGLDAFIYVTDPDTDIILFINEPMKRHFNIQDDGIGNYCYKILQSGIDDRCEFCPCIQLDKKPDKTIIWEEKNTITNRTYQNTDRYIEWLGGIKVHLRHSVDITDIKQAMEGKLSAEREAIEMRHEKEKAESAAKAKSDFLAKMSHEIRTPMNAVMGMSEIILRKNLPQDIYENALGIKSASMNLLSIINDILDFSKIESGMMEIVETNYLLPSLINDVVGIIRIRLIDKPIHFIVNISPDIPGALIGDEVRIRQILINLLSNAVKYTNEGFIALKITGETGGGSVILHIEISDSGIGIKKEDIDKLFGDFVQIDAVKNKGIVGTGLGLAITRNLARLMNGDVTLHSEYEKGSTFTVILPQRFDEFIPFVSTDKLGDKSILLYETRQAYRDSLITEFSGMGVKYESVGSIPELFENLEEFDYVFVSSFIYGSLSPVLSKLKNPPQLVLLSDITETIAPRDATILSLPAYSLSIANVLEGKYESYDSTHVIGASFTAPEAKVMVVDDVAANLKVSEGLMLPYEMQVTLCKSGREAIELIENNAYDLIFMDHMMPEMDGLEATRLIRAIPGEYYKNLPIVALTANAVSGVREMFIQNGMNDFLSKPIETAKLDTILEKWIPQAKKCKASIREEEEETDFVAALRNIPELFVEKALSVVGGSFKTYERMVKLSIQLLPDNISRLNELLDDGDMPNYAIEVHGIKGVLNNIGAYNLGETAYRLEEAAKHSELDICREFHPELIDKLNLFANSMNELLLEDEVSDKPEGELAFLWEALPQLEDAIDYCDNVSATKILASICKYTYEQTIDEILLKLNRAFERFDFDEAEESLKKLKGVLAEWAR